MSNHSYAIIPAMLSLVLSSAGLTAAEEQGVPESPEVPLPELVVDGEVIEPEVTIIKREEGTIYEYRINGQLYMVKVQPDAGPPYYMVDRDGDGEFDSRSTDPTNISVPQWILMRW
ncbi:MAG: DUF2782 domain-containing protein [Candidatus Thiodiazotropha endolucinida]|nr:DUF2782 domain-containing protein [Candidatus Thiodiazotropha sp. (ex Codakia orbicularis)]MCG7864506.1 DUF2782 domain-containing protein [Candidatus Thiodiazotropha endolucinida]